MGKKIQSSKVIVDQRIVEAKQMQAAGMAAREIAEKMGLSTGAIGYYLNSSRKHCGRDDSVPKRYGPVPKGRIVSVLGSPVMNGNTHHEWFIAGYLSRYAQDNNLDVKGLVEDVKSILVKESR